MESILARACALFVAAAAGCSSPPPVGTSMQAFESADAVLYDFELDGVVTTRDRDPARARRRIETQLLYSVGALNAERSVGRHPGLSLSNIEIEPAAAGAVTVRYHARLPVGWGGEGPPPASYELVLPAAVDAPDQERFATTYAARCSDPEGGIVSAADAGRMFLFYRPMRAGCTLAPNDVVRITATTRRSAENTTGKYPEYDRVWEDGALEVVAIFGVERDFGAQDAGFQAFERFAHELGVAPLAGRRTIDYAASLEDGRRVHVQAALVGTVLAKEAPTFDAWFDAATPRADLVVYSGHAGLGANVHTLMTKGSFVANQYLIWFVNGCDTLAYGDRTLADRRAVLNPDDPTGTRHMDIVVNALGSWFSAGDTATLSFVRALTGAPRPYRSILDDLDRDQVAVVLGEEDNRYTPPPPDAVGAPLRLVPGAVVEPASPDVSERGCTMTRQGNAQAPWLSLLVLALLWKRRSHLVARAGGG